MKILHIYKDYDPVIGGIENHVRMLAEAQARQGHRVTVLVTSLTRRTTIERRNRVLVVRAARLAHVASTPLSVSMPLLLRRLRADIAHLHFPYPMGEFSALLALQASRVVFTYHSDVVRQASLLRFYRPLMHRMLERADAIIATSPPYVARSPVLQYYRDKVHVVPLGIYTNLYSTADPARTRALKWEWSPYGNPLILFVGKLRYYKGLDVLLRAVPYLPRGRVVIVGSGPEHARLDSLCQRLQLEDRVHFLGELSDQDLFAFRHAVRESGGLFVLPSTHHSEAFGTVILEAMAAGLPIVSTELGTGTSWINQEGVTGLVVPPGDAEALARAITTLLSDPERMAEMGRAAQQRAQHFSVRAMVARVEEVYRTVLEAPEVVRDQS